MLEDDDNHCEDDKFGQGKENFARDFGLPNSRMGEAPMVKEVVHKVPQ